MRRYVRLSFFLCLLFAMSYSAWQLRTPVADAAAPRCCNLGSDCRDTEVCCRVGQPCSGDLSPYCRPDCGMLVE